jgi:predicted nucleic acid-binding protein
MRVLLDTNIVVHREAPHVVIKDIGVLFLWLDRLRYTKCVHPITVQEINRLKNRDARQTFNIKLTSYDILKAPSSLHSEIIRICAPLDNNENDSNDTLLINEVYNNRVDILITEDRKIRKKAELLNIADRVFSINSFLEKVIAENPELADYKVLSVRKDYFGRIDINDEFFNSLKEDYPGFQNWFNSKSQEEAYICRTNEGISAFLYLKVEDEREPYPDIAPVFPRKKRLKVGTFKAALNRHMIGERLVKIVFDNAISYGVDEIYVTTFDKRIEQRWLIKLLEVYGFVYYGKKQNEFGDESVYVRDMKKGFDSNHPKLTYPYISKKARSFIVSIYPDYHTNLFPDSILKTESPRNFVENEPFRNAISKVFISRSHFKDLLSGDLIVFYRTGGLYKSVISTIGIVESVIVNIDSPSKFIRLCKKRSVFSDQELLDHWNYYKNNRPFIVNFLYAYSFPKRINMKRLIEISVIADVHSAPRGFELLSPQSFELILKETNTDERIIVN